MAKKKLRSKYTSQGGDGGRLVAGYVARTDLEKALDKQAAFKAGRDPWITIANPNIDEGNRVNTNKRFIRVKMSSVYANPKTGKRPGESSAKNA